MGTLYIGLDFFCPGAFVPSTPLSGAETYPHEAKAVFAVLQAALTTDTKTDPLPPAEYFAFTGPDLSNHQVVFVSDALSLDLRQRIAASAIPVPFPPDTALRAVWQSSGAAQPIEISRTIPSTQTDPAGGLASPLLLPVSDWPSFADVNFAAPPIRTYADVALVRPERRDGIEKDLMSWAISLAASILHQHRDPDAPTPTAAERDAYALLAPLDLSLGPADAPTPQTEEMIRAFLQASPTVGGTPRVGLLWERMLQPPIPADPRPILPPRFLHDQVSLATAPVRLLDLGEPVNPPWAVSYHQKIWRDLCHQVAAQPVDGPATQALGRLYAFGERLRWPMTVMDDPAFMVLDEVARRATLRGWSAFGTNVHSLLGQVFRLPVHIDDDVNQAAVHFEVQGHSCPDMAPALRTLLADVAAPRAQTATIARDADRPGGFFLYAPKMAEMTAGSAPTGSATPYAIPSSLLDAVDHKPRWSAPQGGPTLSLRVAARMALREAELYRPELAGTATARRLAVPARLLKLGATFRATTALFELVIGTDFHDDESVEIQARFMRLGQWGGQVWLTIATAPGVAAWDLTGQVLSLTQDSRRGLIATVVDRSGPAGLLADLVDQISAPVPGGKNDVTLNGAAVELILPPASGGDPLFNRVMGGLVVTLGDPERPPICVLKDSFTSRVSACADRILDRFELTYTPSPSNAPATQPVVGQFGDFNKLRLALSSDASAVTKRAPAPLIDGRWVTFLNYPDAVAPMPSAGYQPSTPPWFVAAPQGATTRHFGYFLSQIFTQDAKAAEKGDPNQRLAAESLRYVNYLTPEIAWRIEGYAEHQYTFRFPLTGADMTLPLASDIQNPATAALRADNQDEALIAWAFSPTPPTLELSFSRKFLKLATAVDPGADARPASLRAVYEPLADLIAAIDYGTAELRLERWAFDPDGPDGTATTGRRAQDSGSLAENMRLIASHRRSLRPTDVLLAPLAVVRALLNQPLAKFETDVASLASGPGDTWLKLALPFDTSWSDLPNPGVVSAESDVLRLGLDLARSPGSVVPATFADPAAPARTPGFGLAVDADRIKKYPELANETFAALHDPAAKELGTYLSVANPTSLRRRFDWIRSLRPPQPAPISAGVTDPEQTNDPRRLERLFGETTAFLVAPSDRRPTVPRVLDLFYVPLSFRPLRPHPKIGDSETTLEFAEFLAQLLDDICSGREPQYVGVQALTAAEAHAVRSSFKDTLLPTVTRLVADLVVWVHNTESGVPGNTLFGYVHDLMGRVMGDARNTLADLFQATPGLFATSKGFGLVLFEPDAWSSRLHSLQLRKQIHPAGRPDALGSDPSRFDVDQFVFPKFKTSGALRYTVDILDDKRYDNEFEIDESVFDPRRPDWKPGGPGVVLHDHRLRQRGDLQARTGEDVIEQQNRFDDGAARERQVEADAVHWNPNWTVSAPGVNRQFYLLPSRRRPATPVKLKPRPGATPARCTLPLTLTSPIDRPVLNNQLSTAVIARLRDNNAADFGTSGGHGLIAARLASPLFGQLQPPRVGQMAPGWWCLESYASEHYFVVEADEEASGPDGPFNNDRFRIEVDLGEQPFADEEPTSPAKYAVSGEIGAWFTYQRLKAADPTGIGTKPADVGRQALELEMKAWLAPPNPDDGLMVPAPPVDKSAGPAPATATLETKVTWFAPGKLPAARLRSNDPQGVGSVLAAEVMQLMTDAPSPDRFVLKVMVLDEPWRYTRVRVRVERNLRDVNDDDIPDINPAFQMFGDYSSWSSHGREPVDIDFRTLQKHHFPDPLVTMTPQQSLDTFLRDAGPFDYGDLLGAALNATFTDSTGANQFFWDQTRARSSRYGLNGLIIQRRPDLHPRYAQIELADQLETRIEDVPRLHLTSLAPDLTDPAPMRDFTPLLRDIDKTHVPSPHHAVQVVWSNPRGETVLSCLWPVRFKT
ncbi:hypothetical protein NKI59_26890 [Mesorhizobium sp. M0598]|uniref:hypothetical protein n=1 Tax=Mesorhizobium sp. M0598 TaxID=2956968 RepID=UPI003334C54E